MPTNWGAIAPAFIGRNYMKGQPNKDNTIAFCHNIIHSGALSESMVKKHECIQKNCRFFEKNLENKDWARRESLSAAKKRDKLLKWYADKSGTGVKKVKGNLLKVSSSAINTDMERMLSFFKDFEVYHTYLFYQEDVMKMKYLGGFYNSETAIEKAREIVRTEAGEYVLISDESCEIVGYRVLERNRNLVEVDLSWGNLYKALRKLVEEDILLRISDKEEAI